MQKAAAISAKPIGVCAGSQSSTLRSEQSGFVDTHRGDGKRFVVRADEKPTAFLELEAAIRTCGRLPLDIVTGSFQSSASTKRI